MGKEGRREGGKEGRREGEKEGGKKNIFVTLSINQTEFQQININMKSDKLNATERGCGIKETYDPCGLKNRIVSFLHLCQEVFFGLVLWGLARERCLA